MGHRMANKTDREEAEDLIASTLTIATEALGRDYREVELREMILCMAVATAKLKKLCKA